MRVALRFISFYINPNKASLKARSNRSDHHQIQIMNARYRAAIIGLGRIASLMEKDPLRGKPCTHAGFYNTHSACELVAGSDIKEEKRKVFCEDWGLESKQVYTDYREMLEAERPDLVSICAYAPDRLTMCRKALESGARGLWIEKTLGCSLQEATTIQELVHQHGARAVVDYPRRARAPFRVIKRLIEQETYGRLQSITCHMTHQLLHTGTHAYDVLRYWSGEAEAIQGSLEIGFEGNEVEDQGGTAQIQMSSGTTVFVSAKKKKFYIFQFDLMFDNARILIGNDIQKIYLPGESQNYTGFKELFESEHFNWSDPHREHLLQDLIDAIEKQKEPLSSIENAIASLKIGLGIFYSHQQNKNWIHPDEVPEDFYTRNL